LAPDGSRAVGALLHRACTTIDRLLSFVVHLPGKPEHRKELEQHLFGVLDPMAKEPNFVNAWAHGSLEDPDTIVLYETWACSREHFINHHLKASYRQEYEAALPRLLARERSVEFLSPLRSYPQRQN
jgi:quinol monooxygenase YgiN